MKIERVLDADEFWIDFGEEEFTLFPYVNYVTLYDTSKHGGEIVLSKDMAIAIANEILFYYGGDHYV